MLKERYEYSKALFGDIFKDSLIFHIPHASTYLPFINGYNMDLVENEINLLTDWATDKIFDVAGTKKLIAPFSRIFCDVERFEDDFEENSLSIVRSIGAPEDEVITRTRNIGLLVEFVSTLPEICDTSIP
jgi:N-formylglutamate amidohydrolase